MLELIESDGLSIGGGPPYFVTSLLDHPDCTAEHLRTSRPSASAGRRCPPRSPGGWPTWASSCSAPTAAPSTRRSPDRAATRPRTSGCYTDGNARPGVEIRLGPRRRDLQPRARICASATPIDELTAKAFDDDGWYRTGDVGVLDDDGYLTITDRKADVIIRGGENISALEVEEVLLAMPAVAEAVVVAAPDDRLGERAAAVLRVKPGHDDADARRGARRTSSAAGRGHARSGRRSCIEVDDYPAHRERQGAEVRGPPERLASAGSALRTHENRILPRGKGVFQWANFRIGSTYRFRCSTRTTTSTSRRRR